MKKPYYDPKTKETYEKCVWNGITFKIHLGSVEMGNVETKRPTVWRNCFGEVLREEMPKQYIKVVYND